MLVLVRTSRVDCRSVWLARSTVASPTTVAVARPDQLLVLGEQIIDAAREPHPRGVQHDQVVADPFQVGQQVRGEQHRGAGIGDAAHQGLQELSPRERIQPGDRLVKQQQPRPLRQGEGERDLRSLSTG